jgi:GAF domain-containing protein
MVGQLEIRVEERTKDLQRRAVETQAAVEIGRAATSLRDLESLILRTAELITERFGFYHAGIFLVDEVGEYAVLKAASSEGGKRMLERGHRLKVGQTGIVGFVTRSGRARIALDVGQDAVYFDNPDLPGTRSEMALPLIIGEQILGALDVQSLEPQAFTEQDIATLQILADQLAIAVENARLFSETQRALEATRLAYGDISREAWARIIRTQSRLSYIASAAGSVGLQSGPPSMDVARTIESGDVIISGDGRSVGVPIKIRGQAIGALRLKKSDTANAWSPEEIALAVSLSEQLSGALESARLYKESQQRAAREALVSDISARITALPRIDTILRETAQELGQAIGNASVTFQLLEAPQGGEPATPRESGADEKTDIAPNGKEPKV